MNKKLFIFTILFFSFFIISCNNLFDILNESNTESSTQNASVYSVKIKIVSKSALSRGALPTVDIKKWSVEATSSEGKITLTDNGDSFVCELLANTEYTLTATGYNSSSEAILIGSTSFIVGKDTLYVSIPVEPVNSKSSINLKFDASSLTNYSSLTYTAMLDGVRPAPITLNEAIGTVYYADVSNGIHSLEITATTALGQIISEYHDSAIYIWAGVTDKWYNADGSTTDTVKLAQTEFLYVRGADPNVIFVPSDDTTGNGTIGKPFATISRALERCVSPGIEYKIYIDGTFNEDVNILNKVTIKGLGDTKAIINGTGTSSVISASNPLYLSNLVIQNGTAYNGGGICYTGNNLTVENCEISNNKSTSAGGGIYSSANATITLNNVEISNNKSNNNGGGIFMGAGILNLTGCTVNENEASIGGGIYGFTNSTLTLTNVHVSKNTAVWDGGGIYTSSGSTLNLVNGQINNNAAERGGGTYVTGTLNFTRCSVDSNTATIDGAGIYYFSNTTATLKGGKISDNIANNNGGGLYGTGAGNINISDGLQISGNTANNDGGGIYNADAMYIDFNSTSSIIKNSATGNGGGVAVYNGNFHVQSAIIGGSTENQNTATGNGGGIYLAGENGRATVESAGGEVSYNKATKGGGIYSATESSFLNIYHKVSYNIATESGGGVYIENGQVDINGTISSNSAEYYGGGIFIENGQSVKIRESTIGGDGNGNHAGGSGGGIYYLNGTLVFDKTTISYNIASVDGGGLAIEYEGTADVTLSSATIQYNETTEGSATSGGGGIDVLCNHGAQVTLDNFIISNNTTNKLGGGILVCEGTTLNLSNTCSIERNKAISYGGGICNNNGTVNLTGIPFNSNSTSTTSTYGYGGAYYQQGSSSNTTLSGCSFNSNIAQNSASTAKGGAIYISEGTLSINAGNFDSNKANAKGGALFQEGGTINIKGVILASTNTLSTGTANNFEITRMKVTGSLYDSTTSSSSNIGITMSTPGIFAEAFSSNNPVIAASSIFVSDLSNYEVGTSGGDAILLAK